MALESVSRLSRMAGFSAAMPTIADTTTLSSTVLPRLISASTRLPSPRRSAARALPPLPETDGAPSAARAMRA